MVAQRMIIRALCWIPLERIYRLRMVDIALATNVIRSGRLEHISFALIGRSPELIDDRLKFSEEVNELELVHELNCRPSF